MATTILALIQDFCETQNLPVPSALVGSQEKSTRQLKALSLEVIRELAEFRWQNQRLRGTWAGIAAFDQGTLESLFGAGYLGLIPGTLWNDTRKIPISGPVSEQVWQAMQVLPNAGPEYQCWVSNNHLYVSPAPATTDTLSGIYVTKYAVLSATAVPQERILADTDTLVFPDHVFYRGLKYVWKRQKGEAGWEDDYNYFTGLIAKNIVKDGAPTLSLSVERMYPRPGITIPAGSWNV